MVGAPMRADALRKNKSRQRKADGKEEIDNLIDVKLAKLQRKTKKKRPHIGGATINILVCCDKAFG